MWYFLIISIFCMVERSNSQSCPARYKRFAPAHTFCVERNPQCEIKLSGVSKQDIQDILKIHNEYRSKVALGKESRAIGGSLPKAADMLQMVWDDELATIAQKMAENCIFNHDCLECRAVENFSVGQNINLQTVTCQGYGCKEDEQSAPDWQETIKDFYEEVLDYQNDWIWSYENHPGPMIGHFTQVIWSKTWRIGCGYAAYKDGNTYKRFYVCNYGPTGNAFKDPVYIQGQPCSFCPKNSCCGSSCGGGLVYPGLCKMSDPSTAPDYLRPWNLFYCRGVSDEAHCQADVSPASKWKNVKSIGGNYDSVVLDGGESTTVSFNKPIISPNKDSFCLLVNFRKGPLDSSRTDASSFEADFKMKNSFASPILINAQSTIFKDFAIDLHWGVETKIGFTFSVPKGAGQHILDLREISAFDGPCDS